MTRTTLLALPVLSLLVACPPVEPPDELLDSGRVRLARGAWTLTLADVELEGRCPELDARDLEGLRIDGELHLTPDRAVLDLDGVIMRGAFDGHVLAVEGTLEDEVVYEDDEEHPDDGWDTGTDPGDDREDESDEGDEDGPGAPPPGAIGEEEGEEEPRPGEGDTGDEDPWVSLKAEALAADRMTGVLEIEYRLPGERCTVIATAEGRHHADRGEPERPDEDEPRPGDDDEVDVGVGEDCPDGEEDC